MNVEILVHDGKVVDAHHDGKGCSICCSSASVMSETSKGKSIEQAKAIISDFYELVKGEEPKDEEALGEAIAYEGVRDFPSRIKYATLSWKTVEQATVEVEHEGK